MTNEYEPNKEDKRYTRKVIITTSLLFLVLGLLVGYIFGYSNALNFCVDKAFYLLEKNGYDLQITIKQMAEGVARYASYIK